jgi:hypothetical protein
MNFVLFAAFLVVCNEFLFPGHKMSPVLSPRLRFRVFQGVPLPPRLGAYTRSLLFATHAGKLHQLLWLNVECKSHSYLTLALDEGEKPGSLHEQEMSVYIGGPRHTQKFPNTWSRVSDRQPSQS